ncbi:MAG: gamma carbonic anhydrase family protein [Deltaproteobacteria bacterium]|nr:MAG: gamma carbonic anhydrase family protein [Deltaproteobacteria bacterium]
MSDPRILSYQGVVPVIGPGVFVADSARVIGDVQLGAEASVWFGTVVRGDVHPIRIGARTNVQDLTMIHVTSKRWSTIVGDDVTIGHRAVLHGCTVHDRVLVGMGAIIMDGAVIGEDAMVGAGALVTPGTVIPPRTLALGSPARPVRDLRDDELAYLPISARHYVGLAATYLAAGHGRIA